MQNVFNCPPRLDGHSEEVLRASDPALSWLRQVGIAVEKDSRLDEGNFLAELQRRFLNKLRAQAATASASPLSAECAKLSAENAKLKSEVATLKREVATLNRLLDGAREHADKLEARLKRPRPEPKPKPQQSVDEEMAQKLSALRRKNNELRRRLHTVAHESKTTALLKPGDRKKILAGVHPDGVLDPATAQRLNIASQIIGELFQSGRLKEIEIEN